MAEKIQVSPLRRYVSSPSLLYCCSALLHKGASLWDQCRVVSHGIGTQTNAFAPLQ